MAKGKGTLKAAKKVVTAKTAVNGKKKRRSKKTETYGRYIYKVLKQVHPGMLQIVKSF